MIQTLHTDQYQQTRQAWRDIWIDSNFESELAALSYPRAQETLSAYEPFLSRTASNIEAGCGMGQVVYYWQQRGYPMLGLDYAPEAVKLAKETKPELALHVGDVHHLPFPSNYFGSYMSFGVLEHFEQGPDLALAEAYRVVRPGGSLILTIPHPNIVETLRDTVNRLFPKRLEQIGKRADYYECTYTHDQLAAHVERVGFQIALMKPTGHSYTFFGLHSIFRQRGYYKTSPLGDLAGAIGKTVLPWQTAFNTLICAHKPTE